MYEFTVTAEKVRLGDVTTHGIVTDYIKGELDGNANLVARIEFNGAGPMVQFPHDHVFTCN